VACAEQAGGIKQYTLPASAAIAAAAPVLLLLLLLLLLCVAAPAACAARSARGGPTCYVCAHQHAAVDVEVL
jgi:hypothetical protein